MTAIQFILIAALLFAGIYVYLKFQSAVADAILLLVFIATGIVFVLFPQITTQIANKLGVGRGTDLIVYLCIVFFLFVVLRMYAKIRKLEQMVTKIVRENSLRGAKESPAKISDQ
jgi:small membrane protein